MNLKLPRLKKVDRPQKKKILLISDDMRFFSGVGTMSREIVEGTCNEFDWVQLGAAINHPDHGKIIDVSTDIEKKLNIKDVDVRIYAHTGYGNQEVLREVIEREKPNAVMIFTDPRFFEHVFLFEHELHYKYGIPLIYYSIWDNLAYPYHNIPYYISCDALLGISKQSDLIHKHLVEFSGNQYSTIDNHSPGKILCEYIPHGINPSKFYPILPDMEEYESFGKWKSDFHKKYGVTTVIFWNNRNVRRKQPGDVILAYKLFLDGIPEKDRHEFCLLMKTDPQDPNGTDLYAVKDVICPDAKVIFNTNAVDEKGMNWLYNLADVTLNIASNEGFGLSQAESLMVGTPVVGNVTGGLQDTLNLMENGKPVENTFERPSNHSNNKLTGQEYSFPVFPNNRSLQGSLATPYILDDRCSPNDVANTLHYALNSTIGKYQSARTWMLSKESGFSSMEMCDRFIKAINTTIENFGRTKQSIIKINKPKKVTNSGVI